MTIETMMIGIMAGCFSSLIGLAASWQLGSLLAIEPDRYRSLAKLAMHGLTLLLLLLALEGDLEALQGYLSGYTIFGLFAFIIADEGLRLDRLEAAVAGAPPPSR